MISFSIKDVIKKYMFEQNPQQPKGWSLWVLGNNFVIFKSSQTDRESDVGQTESEYSDAPLLRLINSNDTVFIQTKSNI